MGIGDLLGFFTLKPSSCPTQSQAAAPGRPPGLAAALGGLEILHIIKRFKGQSITGTLGALLDKGFLLKSSSHVLRRK